MLTPPFDLAEGVVGLEERIQFDYIAAMRSGDTARKDALRFLRSALRYASIEARGPLDDAQVGRVLRQQAKMRRDSIEQFEKGGREDLASQERAELAVIESYLPQQMDAAELEAIARRVIADVGATAPGDMGRVMRPLMEAIGDRADGKTASDTVRRLLSP
jgi:hypothetical protein